MKEVMLYSGGLDSVILAAMYPKAKKVYFNVNSKYSKNEIEKLPSDVIIDNTFDFSKIERDDAIVPFRNLYFVTRAIDYGSDIYLAVTSGDSIKDKDETFFTLAQQLNRHINSSWWGYEYEPTYHYPLKKLSKAQAIRNYLDSGHSKAALLDSFSCYTPIDNKQCGKCKCCVRKYASLLVNDIDSTFTFASVPHDSEAWQNELATSRRGVESEDIKKAEKIING